jgi:hypothetical protein
MSHFTVLVIGQVNKTLEQQLQPFHEFECTGDNDKYVQEIDVTEEAREHGLDWFGYDAVTDESLVDRNGDHKYGYAIVDKDGKLVKAVTRTNPNAKWDWWQIGGRWSGLFKLKPGAAGELGNRSLLDRGPDNRSGYADIARKCDIDFAAMRDEAGVEAGKRWDVIHEVCGAHMGTLIPWKKMRDEVHPGNIEAARAAYAEQEAIRVRGEACKHLEDSEKQFLIWADLDEYQCSREVYVQRARNSACATFAIVKDGQWYERGSMGWWGMVSDEQDAEVWGEQFAKMLDELPDDTVLTVVDCHI